MPGRVASGLRCVSLAPLGRRREICIDATIDRVNGGYSSAAERLTVAQDVVGSIPTSRPKVFPKLMDRKGLAFSRLTDQSL